MFCGAPADRNSVDAIISEMTQPAINLCGKISLGGLAALISAARLVIGPDTGPLHLARAVSTPTVGMYWAPNLINWGPLTRKLHVPLISWNLPCPLCGIIPNEPYPFEPTGNCSHAVSFVRDIHVEEVLRAVENILSTENQLTGVQLPDN
ncbi:MAG: glycosyltransferase family 9 protein [Chitinophagaceae bacterium]|nr:glycosyltransferase family 9 protein [Chitinophagaceae bacterium]